MLALLLLMLGGGSSPTWAWNYSNEDCTEGSGGDGTYDFYYEKEYMWYWNADDEKTYLNDGTDGMRWFKTTRLFNADNGDNDCYWWRFMERIVFRDITKREDDNDMKDTQVKGEIHVVTADEEALFAYFGNKTMREQGTKISPYVLNYVRNGKLNMEHVVTRFRDLLREEYRESTVPFLEREGRLLFLTFLKPVINGIGFYYVEPETRDNRRMDLVVTYERQEFIVELKIWRGDKYEERGRDQLSGYLETRGMDEGYLVTFDFSKGKEQGMITSPHWQEHDSKQIFEVII